MCAKYTCRWIHCGDVTTVFMLSDATSTAWHMLRGIAKVTPKRCTTNPFELQELCWDPEEARVDIWCVGPVVAASRDLPQRKLQLQPARRRTRDRPMEVNPYACK